MKTLVPVCYCGSEEYDLTQKHALPVLVCRCGAMRQHVLMDLDQYAAWYGKAYHSHVYYHSYQQDHEVASIRADSYDLKPGTRLLDVGCGNNAFVDECRERGIDAWGQDLALQSDGSYSFSGDLHSVAFPAESFDVVTMHDVLEHVPDPVPFLLEIRRLLKPNGTLFLDFPRFHHEAGRHHWKLVEHLWLLDERQLSDLLRAGGFRVRLSWNPIESKIAIGAEPEQKRRISVVVPPGIGDSYWSLTKVPGLLRQQGAEIADVWVHEAPPRRTEPYIRNVAFCAFQGYREHVHNDALCNEAYRQDGRSVFPGEFGADFFVSMNGALTHGGRSLESVHPELGTEWRPRTHMSKEALTARKQMEAGGPYVVAYFVNHGMYKRWMAAFPVARIEATLNQFRKRGYRIVIIGAEWDRPLVGAKIAQRSRGKFVDMIGQTSFDQMYGLIAGASAVVGFPAGCTLLAPTLGVPTVLLWHRFFNPKFWVNSVAPGSPYRALDVHRLRPDAVLRAVDELKAGAAAA